MKIFHGVNVGSEDKGCFADRLQIDLMERENVDDSSVLGNQMKTKYYGNNEIGEMEGRVRLRSEENFEFMTL